MIDAKNVFMGTSWEWGGLSPCGPGLVRRSFQKDTSKL